MSLEIKNPYGGSSITLHSGQVPYFQQFYQTLLESPLLFNILPMGFGKSYITLALVFSYFQQKWSEIITQYEQLLSLIPDDLTHLILSYVEPQFSLLIICQAGVRSCWQNLVREFQIPTIGIFSYTTWSRGRKNIYLDGYEITDQFKDLVAQGVLIVLDEPLSLPNDRVIRTLRPIIKYIQEEDLHGSSLSRVIILGLPRLNIRPQDRSALERLVGPISFSTSKN